ncbi:uncharacterized protein LOC120442776 [Oreochromis aureus]|uniref:uncharacterized protein LOC120442776 n=1 Tax=Oreochromis aureus TaxID=47969 RepID=UPI001953CE63|nr:uncharacterized protein LOC120442776 [Oreochromis aureus]
MKLGLLVVVAVAVLLPSFSESRIVSKCELKDKLGKTIDLPRKSKERILAIVICEVERRSDLNTTLIESFGKCIPATPKPTVAVSPSATGVNQMSTGAATLTNNNSTSTSMTNSTTVTNTTTSPASTNSTISSMNTTLVSNSAGVVKRRKRDADSSSHERRKNSKEGGRGEGKGHDETSSEEDTEPKNLYGLFQLSDRKFCDSGYCPSENVCHTSCTAFTDDDITDDIACVIQTGYWREIEMTASESCRRTWNFFKECN